MMLYPAMNKLTEYIPNRYMMVNVVARRARQIAAEAAKRLGAEKMSAQAVGGAVGHNPIVTEAINEVAEGKFVANPVIEEENI